MRVDRIKNKFFLILAGIVGLCLSFCTFLMPKKVDVASADTTSMVESSTHYYVEIAEGKSFVNMFTTSDAGKILSIFVFSNSTLIGSSSARLRFSALSDYFGYLTLRSSGLTLRYAFYIPCSRGDLAPTRVDFYITDSNTFETELKSFNENGMDGISVISRDYASEAYDSGYEKGYTTGYSDGYHTAENKFYQEGYDVGYANGQIYGYDSGFIEANRGLWSPKFDFSWIASGVMYEVSLEVSASDLGAVELFNNGGIVFSKLYPLFEEACSIQGVSVPDVANVPITVTNAINPSDLDFQILTTFQSLTRYDGYYTSAGQRIYGSFQSMDVADEGQFFAFETYNTLSVIPDSFSFTFDETWDFIVYCWDKRIGYADYNVGYDYGYQEGYFAGVDEGEKVSQTELNNAYNNGYAVGLSKAEKFDFAYAVSTVVGAPVQVVKEFLSFELLGVNMLAFFSGIFSLLIIVKVIKFFI